MKRHAPATERNREPILEILARVLPSEVTVLEIASGSGQHAIFFAERLAARGIRWQPTDADEDARASIAAYEAEAHLANLMPPIALDATADAPWPTGIGAIFCANMIHIAPWAACEGLMKGAGRCLAPGGLLLLYGPFKRGGQHTAPSNAAFEERLRSQNPAWGVRDLEAVTNEASGNGLSLREIVTMPANNLTLVFTRT
jgi:SAM-dependent methyltransferase